MRPENCCSPVTTWRASSALTPPCNRTSRGPPGSRQPTRGSRARVAAGHPSRYGATIIEIADDPDHPYHPLALLALDGQETQPELALWLRNGSLTGLQEVVCTLHVPWSLSLIHISEPTRLGMISYA